MTFGEFFGLLSLPVLAGFAAIVAAAVKYLVVGGR